MLFVEALIVELCPPTIAELVDVLSIDIVLPANIELKAAAAVLFKPNATDPTPRFASVQLVALAVPARSAPFVTSKNICVPAVSVVLSGTAKLYVPFVSDWL